MEFYEALKMCVNYGAKITRRDWNGKDMYVYYTKGKKIPVDRWHGDEPTQEEKERGYVEIAGHFDMKNAQGIRIIGWSASQTDLTSNEWTWYVPKNCEIRPLTRENYFEEDDPDDHANRNWPNPND